MSTPKGIRKRIPTEKQAKTAQGITERVKAGEPLSRELIVQEHIKHYDVQPSKGHSRESIASTIASQNMQKIAFLSSLGLTDQDARTELFKVLWSWLFGLDPKHKHDKDLKKLAATLLSKGAIVQHEHVVHTEAGDLASKSIDELRFFELFDRFPTAMELQQFVAEGPTHLAPPVRAN
jgi:hypothetical protein